MRGWSRGVVTMLRHPSGSPAYAGMVLEYRDGWALYHWFPRVCGDGPFVLLVSVNLRLVPPRMRGWSYDGWWKLGHPWGSPAYAGMVHM